MRDATKRPQRILQPFRQGHETLAAEHDMGMLEAAIGEPEVVEPVIERLAGNGDAEAGHIGEIRQPEMARPVGLAKDNLLLLAVNGAPGADAPLQRAAHPLVQFGMSPRHLLENGHRPDAGRGFEQRNDLLLKYTGKRIRTPPAAWRLLLRWQPRILLDAVGGRHADRRLRRGDGRRIGLSELHVEPHLVIGYVAAGHKAVPPNRKTTGIPGRPQTPVKAP